MRCLIDLEERRLEVLVRVDSSYQIGSGHVVRCLTLAKELREKGARVRFVSRPHEGNVLDLVKEQLFELHLLDIDGGTNEEPLMYGDWLGGSQNRDAELCENIIKKHFQSSPDWIIVDHYSLSSLWERRLGDGSRIFVCDDLADRVHDCDLLLDSTHGRPKTDYAGLVPHDCQILAGSSYAILRDEFDVDAQSILSIRKKSIGREIKRILVMMGGTDHTNISMRVLRSLNELNISATVTVVLGKTAPYIDEVREFCSSTVGYELIVGTNEVSKIMMDHDICIGAAGTSSWERCALGLPSALVVFAENQRLIAANLEGSGAIRYLPTDFDKEELQETIRLIFEEDTYLKMVSNCLSICDGRGVSRICRELMYG